MKFSSVFFYISLISLSLPLFAGDPQSFAGKSEMIGHRLDEFKNFEKKWKMVTVRFRKDTGELRFTYANDLAWRALKAGGKSYPQGAVFAKIGLMTNEDPSFASSAVPSGARRYQFMIRDAKKFRDTDGWGYALFDQNGKTFPGDPKEAVQACAACHRIVPERTFVFSEIMELSPHVEKAASTDALKSRIQFETIASETLPKSIVEQIPPKIPQIRKIVGPLNELMFQGTLDEIRPTLYKEAIHSGLPTLLANKAGTSFSLVLLVDKSTRCSSNEQEVMSLIKTSAAQSLLSQSFCIQKDK